MFFLLNIQDLLWLWCELQARADGSLDTFAHSVLKVAQLAANSLQLGMLIQVLHRMVSRIAC